MIPRFEMKADPTIPAAATFWTPSALELEEGDSIGDFHDSEVIVTDLQEARSVIEAEKFALGYLDANCSTALEFDELADQIEFEVPDVPSDEAPRFMHEMQWYGTGNLEIGVAGLTYALNAVGILTGASCRSHADPVLSWSEHPVVIFAANRAQVETLQPLVASAGCGFEMDTLNRPQLLAIAAPSVIEAMALAYQIVENAASFEGIANPTE